MSLKVGELFVQLGVLADSKSLKDFSKAVGDLPLEVAGGIAALVGLEFELVKLTQEAISTAIGFKAFSSQTGLSWQELQKWQIVAEQANVSTETVATSVNALERNLAEIRLGRGNVSPFQLLGISPNQNAFGVLQQLRGAIRGLDRPTATNLITQMGLSPDMIQVLQLSDKEFAHLSKTIHGMTTEQQDDLLKFKQQLVETGLVAKQVSFDFIGHLVRGLEMLMDSLRQIPVYMPALVGSIALLAAAFAPVTTAIVALLLLLDDLAVYASGGKSLIGTALGGLDKFIGPKASAAGQFQADHLPEWLTNFLASAGSMLAGSPVPAGGAPRQINQTNNINIHGQSPNEIATAVHGILRQAMGQAEQQVNNQGH